MRQQKWFDAWFAAEREAAQAIRKAAHDSLTAVQRERASRSLAQAEAPSARRRGRGTSRTGAAS